MAFKKLPSIEFLTAQTNCTEGGVSRRDDLINITAHFGFFG
jgi:hypothetical protein